MVLARFSTLMLSIAALAGLVPARRIQYRSAGGIALRVDRAYLAIAVLRSAAAPTRARSLICFM